MGRRNNGRGKGRKNRGGGGGGGGGGRQRHPLANLAWAGTVLFGVGNGPVVGYLYDLAHRNTVNSEHGTSIIMLGLNLGASLVPWVTAKVWTTARNPVVLVVVALLTMAVPLLILVVFDGFHAFRGPCRGPRGVLQASSSSLGPRWTRAGRGYVEASRGDAPDDTSRHNHHHIYHDHDPKLGAAPTAAAVNDVDEELECAGVIELACPASARGGKDRRLAGSDDDDDDDADDDSYHDGRSTAIDDDIQQKYDDDDDDDDDDDVVVHRLAQKHWRSRAVASASSLCSKDM